MYLIILILAILILLYLYAIKPRSGFRLDFEAYHWKYYAHRGLHKSKRKSPENSIKAFQQAMDQGYGIELDVQLTKDKIPVIFHDYNLLRVCGVDKLVSDLSYEEIKKLRLYHSDEQVPKFIDLLDLVNGKVPLLVEIKVEWNAKETCKIVDQILRNYKGNYYIQSFSPLALLWYRIHHKEVLRGQLSTNYIKDRDYGNKFIYFLLQYLLFNFLSRPDFIDYNYKYKNNLSFKLCTKFFTAKSFAWTIRNQEELEESKKDFNYFIFDRFIPDQQEKKTIP